MKPMITGATVCDSNNDIISVFVLFVIVECVITISWQCMHGKFRMQCFIFFIEITEFIDMAHKPEGGRGCGWKWENRNRDCLSGSLSFRWLSSLLFAVCTGCHQRTPCTGEEQEIHDMNTFWLKSVYYWCLERSSEVFFSLCLLPPELLYLLLFPSFVTVKAGRYLLYYCIAFIKKVYTFVVHVLQYFYYSYLTAVVTRRGWKYQYFWVWWLCCFGKLSIFKTSKNVVVLILHKSIYINKYRIRKSFNID